MVFCTGCGLKVTNESPKFCPKCGTTTFQDSEKTDSVVNHTSNNSSIIPTERSKFWYLLPIVFGIVGGLIAYLVLRKSDSKKARNCLIIGIVFTLIALFLFVTVDFFPDDNAGSEDYVEEYFREHPDEDPCNDPTAKAFGLCE